MNKHYPIDQPAKCKEAEVFAYELLMPAKMVRKYILKYKEVGLGIDGLSKIFGVEKHRVRTRLKQLGIEL